MFGLGNQSLPAQPQFKPYINKTLNISFTACTQYIRHNTNCYIFFQEPQAVILLFLSSFIDEEIKASRG